MSKSLVPAVPAVQVVRAVNRVTTKNLERPKSIQGVAMNFGNPTTWKRFERLKRLERMELLELSYSIRL